MGMRVGIGKGERLLVPCFHPAFLRDVGPLLLNWADIIVAPKYSRGDSAGSLSPLAGRVPGTLLSLLLGPCLPAKLHKHTGSQCCPLQTELQPCAAEKLGLPDQQDAGPVSCHCLGMRKRSLGFGFEPFLML